jgi:hypothetical protein
MPHPATPFDEISIMLIHYYGILQLSMCVISSIDWIAKIRNHLTSEDLDESLRIATSEGLDAYAIRRFTPRLKY